MIFLEFLDIFLCDVFDIFDIEKKTDSQLKFYLTFAILEHFFSDPRYIQLEVEYSMDELLIIIFWPIESFLGIEVGMIEWVIFVTDLWSWKCSSHELSIMFVVDLRAFAHL